MGLRSLWGRRQGICKAWFGMLPYVFVSEASKVEVSLKIKILFVLINMTINLNLILDNNGKS